MTGAMASRVLAANLDFSFTIRPSWWVLLAALAMVAVHLASTWRKRAPFIARDQARHNTGANPV
jgi:methionine sulfoxide reductase heme-binding subunit